jgi:hypothetical protein
VFLGDYHFFYACAHFQGARYELGMRFARDAYRQRPGHAYPLLIGSACAGLLGDTKAASALIAEIKELVPNVSLISVESTAAFVLPEDRVRYLEGLTLAGLE